MLQIHDNPARLPPGPAVCLPGRACGRITGRSFRDSSSTGPTFMSETLELTRAMIARPSVSPADGGCQELMIERLERLGFSIERLRFGDVRQLLGHAPRRRGPGVRLAGHTDVVPTGPLEERHTDPFEPGAPRRLPLRPRCGRHEERTGRDGDGGRGLRPECPAMPARSRSSSPVTRKGPRGRHAPGRRGPQVTWRPHRPVPGAGSPRRHRFGDTVKIGAEAPVRPAHGSRNPGAHCVPQLAENPVIHRPRPSPSWWSAGGTRQRLLPADVLPGLEHSRWYRRAECDPGDLRRGSTSAGPEQTLEGLQQVAAST